MANPQNPADFNAVVNAQTDFATWPGKSGSTGDFNTVVTAQIDFADYVTAAAAPTTKAFPFQLRPLYIWHRKR